MSTVIILGFFFAAFCTLSPENTKEFLGVYSSSTFFAILLIANMLYLFITGYFYVQKINVSLSEAEYDIEAIKSNVTYL